MLLCINSKGHRDYGWDRAPNYCSAQGPLPASHGRSPELSTYMLVVGQDTAAQAFFLLKQ